MTEADQLIAEAKAAGVTITRDCGRLHLRAPRPPHHELLQRLREAKAELLLVVPQLTASVADTDSPAVLWRIAAMRPQLPPYPRPVPLLAARPELPYRVGYCLSCGGSVAAPRCAPCRVAVAAVLAEWAGPGRGPTTEGGY